MSVSYCVSLALSLSILLSLSIYFPNISVHLIFSTLSNQYITAIIIIAACMVLNCMNTVITPTLNVFANTQLKSRLTMFVPKKTIPR